MFAAAAAARAALLLVGGLVDAHSPVKFTDIDYEVVTDGARLLAAGGSPYDRSTYRYTPLLAAALVPNVWLHRAWGKALFCAADLAAGALLRAALARSGAPPGAQRLALAAWLFNPLTAVVSARGNGEALVTVMLLGVLGLLGGEGGGGRAGSAAGPGAARAAAAGALFGLAVHWRLYPVIFAPTLVLHLAGRARAARRAGRGAAAAPPAGTLARAWAAVYSADGAVLGAAAAAAFAGLGAAARARFGAAYGREALLYHASRRDPRHNFSPFFYPAYLADAAAAAAAGGRGAAAAAAGAPVQAAFAAAGGAAQLALAARFAGDLPAALLVQTVALVAFNRVVTAQYFVWYLSFLPLVLPRLAAAPRGARRALAAAGGAWAAAAAGWLAAAYALEFRGARAHAGVWAASVAFLAAHAWVLCELVRALREAPAAAAPPRRPKRAAWRPPPT